MAYMRGDCYIWHDGERIHLWVADGYDGWDEAIWAADEEGARRAGRERASGVAVPETALDDFVVMRFAQIVAEGKLGETVDRVLGPTGQGRNFGGSALKALANDLMSALAPLEPPPGERIRPRGD